MLFQALGVKTKLQNLRQSASPGVDPAADPIEDPAAVEIKNSAEGATPKLERFEVIFFVASASREYY